MLGHELRCFAGKCGLDAERFTPWDILSAAPRVASLESVDAVMVGGSGDYFVSRRNVPNLDATLDFLAEVVERSVPTFASCFGFHLLTDALGGEVVHDPEKIEVGTFELRLTPAGRADPLLGRLPDRFPAQLGRKDRARRLPPGCENLAGSDRCPFQAFRIPGRPIWTTQFHPELSGAENRERYVRYLENYESSLTEEERRGVLDGFRPSPETERLLPRFLELVFD